MRIVGRLLLTVSAVALLVQWGVFLQFGLASNFILIASIATFGTGFTIEAMTKPRIEVCNA